MRLCILCDDPNITEARERSAEVLPKSEFTERLPLSSTGELPATHWFCFINVNETTYQKMLTSQKYTIIEEAVPSEFLAKHNLKKIKKFGTGL